jgi:hypothetical protein
VDEDRHCLSDKQERDILSAIYTYHPDHKAVLSKAKVFLNTLCKTNGVAIQFRNSFEYDGNGRKFFITAKSRMGIEPRLIESGDQIYVLVGGATLFVLRPAVLGQYLFLGECYVDGLMEGEGLRCGRTGRSSRSSSNFVESRRPLSNTHIVSILHEIGDVSQSLNSTFLKADRAMAGSAMETALQDSDFRVNDAPKRP